MPSMFGDWWGGSPHANLMEVKASEAQGRRREAGSEGSVEQTREPMDKNRIRGIRRRTSGRMIAKSRSIKGAGCKSGGCARKVVELTSGDLPPCPGFRTGGREIDFDRAAEVSRGHSSR